MISMIEPATEYREDHEDHQDENQTASETAPAIIAGPIAVKATATEQEQNNNYNYQKAHFFLHTLR
jgi:hypothetical protein